MPLCKAANRVSAKTGTILASGFRYLNFQGELSTVVFDGYKIYSSYCLFQNGNTWKTESIYILCDEHYRPFVS
jgi:hypothetical protein